MGEANLPSLSKCGLQWCFKQLGEEGFETFKDLVKEKASELAACSFPWIEVDNANMEHLAYLLHEHCRGPLVWKISISIFDEMDLPALAQKARDYMESETPTYLCRLKSRLSPNSASWFFSPLPSELGGDEWHYKAHVMTKFAMMSDTHHDFKTLAPDCLQMHMLFGAFTPDQCGFRPLTVVMHGESGVGKSALARRVLLHWARGELYPSLFSYAFFLHAGEIQSRKESSFMELISREWPDSLVPVMDILSQPERLLFVVDGFDDLDVAFKEDDTHLCDDLAEKQPVSVLMRSLLKKVLLPEASLIITVRDVGVENLQAVVTSPRYLLVEGMSMERRTQLFLEHMKNEHQKIQVLHSVVDNDQLFGKCQVPVVWSLICQALQMQEASGKSLPHTCQILTGLYVTFVAHQLTPRDAFGCCLGREERAVLKAVCRMAVEGVWNAKFVFYGDDLRVHGLTPSELCALFHMDILLPDGPGERYYTFPHPSLQEFCAALYYILEGLEREWETHPLFVENIRTLMELKQISINAHLLQVKRFLFGLMNKEVMRVLENLLGCPIPAVVKRALLHWIRLLGQQAHTTTPLDFLDCFYCLFETQDEEFVRLALNSFQAVWLSINRRMDLLVSSYCLQHCQYLWKIQMDVREIFSEDEVTEAWPMIPQGMQTKVLVDDWWENLCLVLSTHPNLRQLDLSGSILNECAMRTLCIKLRQPTCKIQNLIFKRAQITFGLQYLWRTVIINHRIKYLSLEGTHLKEEDMGMVCEALRHPSCMLESLRLDHCGLTHTCCLLISQILLTATRLKSLSLTGNKVTHRGATPLCDALTVSQCALKKLLLGDCGLTAAGCQDLASALISNQRLTHLYLSTNNLGSEGVNLLCRALKLFSCALRRLILNECNLDVIGCGFLALALTGNRHLTHLSLSMNPLGDDGMILLSEAIAEPSCHLQDLELVKCHLTATCCKKLSFVITRSKHLRSLDLAANALGDGGMAALCEGLKQKQGSLRRLGLEACDLTSDCCEALSLALSCNQSLTSLNLMRNNFSPEGIMKLCPAFAHPNSNLQIIGLWKWQYPAQVRKLLEEVQLLKPQVVISDGWYAFDEEDRYWWKN
uniref:NLR family pyrin domain containing 5 n=1 Tax=Rhinolophus ferrumequinum TaxID=59479 RepID=A0A671E471_RHIFE